jgi:hypothetical protein
VIKKLVLLAVALLLLSGCVPSTDSADTDSRAGFWWGLWHGMIAPISFIVGLFNDNVRIYESLNHRGWYDLGFLIGISALGGSAGASSK